MVEIPEGEPPPGGKLVGKAMYFGDAAAAVATIVEWAHLKERDACDKERAARRRDRELCATIVENDADGRFWGCEEDANRHLMSLKEIANSIRNLQFA